MNETEFHYCADMTLNALCDILDPWDKKGTIEVEYENGALSIDLDGGRQLLISKHTPSRQLWLSSPISGGLHFDYSGDKSWQTKDGSTLARQLSQELLALAAIKVSF